MLTNGLAPPGIFFASAAHRVGTEALLPEERDFVARACDKRVGDFATGRQCARRALEALGIPPGPIAMAASRAPLWPDGVVGSITHTDGYTAAIVARRRDFVGIGVDSQHMRPGRITPGMARLILRPEEFDLVADDRDRRLHLIFSAKEALYKTLNPVVERFFGFESAAVTACDFAAGTFTIALTEDLAPAFTTGYTLEGRFAVEADVLTCLLFVNEAP